MKYFLFMLALVPLATQAATPLSRLLARATPTQPLCFGREYPEAQLEARPAQQLRRLRAMVWKGESNDPRWTVELDAELRGEENRFSVLRAFLLCDAGGLCSVECDGGSASLEARANGELALVSRGLALSGACAGPDGEDAPEPVRLAPASGNGDEHRLVALPSAYCQK